MTPKTAQFLLTSDVPDHEVYCFVVEFLDVEANGWDCHEDVSQFEGIQDCCLACPVQPEHYDLALLLWELLAEEAFYQIAHELSVLDIVMAIFMMCLRFAQTDHLRLKRERQKIDNKDNKDNRATGQQGQEHILSWLITQGSGSSAVMSSALVLRSIFSLKKLSPSLSRYISFEMEPLSKSTCGSSKDNLWPRLSISCLLKNSSSQKVPSQITLNSFRLNAMKTSVNSTKGGQTASNGISCLENEMRIFQINDPIKQAIRLLITQILVARDLSNRCKYAISSPGSAIDVNEIQTQLARQVGVMVGIWN